MRKYLVWHECDNERHVNAYVLPNHYGHSLKTFKELATIAKSAFSHLKEDDIECCTVVDSGWCKGCPVVRFYLGDWKGDVPDGWKLLEYRNCDIRTN
jgi:hypothetical protein